MQEPALCDLLRHGPEHSRHFIEDTFYAIFESFKERLQGRAYVGLVDRELVV